MVSCRTHGTAQSPELLAHFAHSNRNNPEHACNGAGESSVSIVNTVSGEELFSARTMDTIWVELAADTSAANGPRLRIRLVSSHHSAVRQASIKAAYPQQSQEGLEPSTTRNAQLGSRQAGLRHALPGSAETSQQQPELHDGFEFLGEAGVCGKQSRANVGGLGGQVQDEARQRSAVLQPQKPRPGQKAKRTEPKLESIAAVLHAVEASLQADATWNSCMVPGSVLGTTVELEGRPEQLVSHVSSPCVAQLDHSGKRTVLQALWDLQLRMAKKSACADAALSLASSDRMMKLQSDMCDLSLELSNLQEQLQVA